MPDTFLTLKGESQGIYKEKGSKFLAFAYPVGNEEEIKQKISILKKKFHDARHHCYAYILGREGQNSRANDDGEPGHSAGDPILGQIRSHNLTNVLIVVVRYFGGTKLGVGGLVSAYKTAAFEALSANEIVSEIVMAKIKFEFDYLDMNEVMLLIKDKDLKVLQQQFGVSCDMTLAIRETLYGEVIKKLEQIPSLRLKG